MRIVLDTNVFISGIFFSGPPHRIFQSWRDGRIQLVLTPEILGGCRIIHEPAANPAVWPGFRLLFGT
ncbi:PIN domain-containing protein [Geoalkalibacter halelectricus]|uniref:PIN domain-containing protein n=1 Tax=Geoalkalibacter halelectricus TaxID=2847045 RepID=UPI00345F582A